MKNNFFFFILITFLLSSCVTTKKFNEQQALADKYLAQSNDCNEKLTKNMADLADLQTKKDSIESALASLSAEHVLQSSKNKNLVKQLDELNEQMNQLSAQNKELLSNATKDKENLNNSILQKQAELFRKENEINQLGKDLKERENRVKELESILNKQDSATTYLKNKLLDALTGFNSNELSIVQRSGKIYVSMSDKLLFKSGSFTLGDKGIDALGKVAAVLKKQTSFNILVEGHTDNVPYVNPAGLIKDNWDLSVMRATTVVKVLVNDNKLDPKRVIASGHGEYNPIVKNDSEDGKGKNRRTEIILSPDLQDIYNILKTK